MSTTSTPGQKIDAAVVAAPFRDEIRNYIVTRLGGVGPRLVGLLANADPAARQYAEWTKKACEQDGIRYEVREVPREDVDAELQRCNEDPDVHGIMIYYPCFGMEPSFFGGSMDDYLRDSVSIHKDVEGLCHTYRYNMYHNIRYLNGRPEHKCILPCTSLSVVKILEYLQCYDMSEREGDRLRDKTITVINRSEIVGRPLAAMLANDGATVYSVDISSIFVFQRGRLRRTDVTAEEACRSSSVIVTGVPVRDYRLNTSWVSPGTAVVNVSSFKNVDADELLQIEGVRYVPLVGKVTVAMLERNLLRLFDNFHSGVAAQYEQSS